MTATLDGTPRLQRNWDSRAAWNFIGGGAGTGLLLVGAAALPSGWPYFFAGALGFALIGFGLSMVWLEIGRPFRALNVFLHPQTSWMSREALFALPLLTLAGIATLADQNFVSLPLQMRLPVTPLASAAAALGLAFLYCQARILRASHGVPAWREPSLQWVIIVTGITEGLGLLLFLSFFVGPLPAWAIPTSLASLIARAGVWEYYRHRLNPRVPVLAIAALSQISLPVHLLGHALPAMLLLVSLVAPRPGVTAVVAGIAMVAAGAWLKFAVVTRAAFTQGFSIPVVPMRGQPSTAAAAEVRQ